MAILDQRYLSVHKVYEKGSTGNCSITNYFLVKGLPGIHLVVWVDVSDLEADGNNAFIIPEGAQAGEERERANYYKIFKTREDFRNSGMKALPGTVAFREYL